MQNTTAKAAAKVNQPALSAVAEALKVTLLGDVSAKIELGGTRSPAALDAYLRASKVMYTLGDPARDLPTAIAEYAEAIRLDPDYALAFAGQSQALSGYAGELATGAAIRRGFEKAEADARRAIARRRPGLVYLRSDPLMDPLPQEPRFKADLRELNFPTD
jgi:tetratricopeptide (TPR) repeat protein